MQFEMFTGPGCSFCQAAKQLLEARGLGFTERDVSDPEVQAEFRERLPREKAIPQIFLDGRHIGGYDDLKILDDRGELAAR